MEEISQVPATLLSVTVDEASKANVLPPLPVEQEASVQTLTGKVKVYIQGTPDDDMPALVTFHDIGMNHKMCFGKFISHPSTRQLVESFVIYHIDAPGHEDGAENMDSNAAYPTMNQLAEIVMSVVTHFHIRKFVGFGVGAGANVLLRFGAAHPKMLHGLLLVSPAVNSVSWLDWMPTKLSTFNLYRWGLTLGNVNNLIDRYYGSSPRANELGEFRRSDIMNGMKPTNVAKFVDAYAGRDAITRQLAEMKTRVDQTIRRLSVSGQAATGTSTPNVQSMNAGFKTMIFAGVLSGDRFAEAEETLSSLTPALSQLVKVDSCGGMVHEERTETLIRPMTLFLASLDLPDAISTRFARMDFNNSVKA
eukprot:Opistho-2@5766